jgi:hypothetical protein
MYERFQNNCKCRGVSQRDFIRRIRALDTESLDPCGVRDTSVWNFELHMEELRLELRDLSNEPYQFDICRKLTDQIMLNNFPA